MLHYVLMIYYWWNGHIYRAWMEEETYETCVHDAEYLSEQYPITWVCIPEGD